MLKTHLLKLGNCLGCSQNALGCIGGYFSCFTVAAASKQIIKLGNEQLIGASKIISHS